MATHGGYRKPANPSPVSGPGAHSKRTDGQVMSTAPDQPYGQQTADMNAQRVAPMAGAPQTPPPAPLQTQQAAQNGPTLPAYTGVPFGAPSQRPDEPVTTGAGTGPGAGPEVLSSFQPQQQAQGTGTMTALLQKFAPVDTTGILGQLLLAAQSHGA